MAHVKLNLSGHANAALEAAGFAFPGVLHVDPADPSLPQKVTAFLAPLVSSGDVVTVALPGMTQLAALVLAVIHGLSGQFPTVQPLVRAEDGQFAPGPTTDLQALRNDVARSNRQQVINL